MRPHFRFEDLEIWQIAKRLAIKLHCLAHQLEERHFYRYAEQLRAAGLSLTNNIAEGSGSIHTQEFKQFLNVFTTFRVRRRIYANGIRST